MARGIYVYVDSSTESLLDEPLGSEAAVRRYWSAPAASLGLPRLAAISEQGFVRRITWRGSELAEVRLELNALVEHWSRMDLATEVAADLAERAGFVRAALVLARQLGGYVAIS